MFFELDILALMPILQTANRTKEGIYFRETHLAFIDYEKAFDTMAH